MVDCLFNSLNKNFQKATKKCASSIGNKRQEERKDEGLNRGPQIAGFFRSVKHGKAGIEIRISPKIVDKIDSVKLLKGTRQ